jgi:hypothetical protein
MAEGKNSGNWERHDVSEYKVQANGDYVYSDGNRALELDNDRTANGAERLLFHSDRMTTLTVSPTSAAKQILEPFVLTYASDDWL